MNLKKIGKVFTSKFVGTRPSSYKKRIYRAAVSQRLRNTALSIFAAQIGAGFKKVYGP
jgi:methylphosphotriester-DNA--protein-cysteine methyltransferase